MRFSVKLLTSCLLLSSLHLFGLRHLSNLTALIPLNGTELTDVSTLPNLSSPDQRFWLPFIDHVKKDVSNAIVTVMRDEDVNDGHIFNNNNDNNNNKTNEYDILLLFHNEYTTQNEYNNLRQFVSNGGTIVFIDSNVFYAQVRYDRDNHTYFMHRFAMTEIIIQ